MPLCWPAWSETDGDARISSCLWNGELFQQTENRTTCEVIKSYNPAMKYGGPGSYRSSLSVTSIIMNWTDWYTTLIWTICFALLFYTLSIENSMHLWVSVAWSSKCMFIEIHLTLRMGSCFAQIEDVFLLSTQLLFFTGHIFTLLLFFIFLYTMRR